MNRNGCATGVELRKHRMTLMNFDENTIKHLCNGMLEPEVYSAMYKAARDAPTSTFVEVGTAHAAGTLSLAFGLRDAIGTGSVITFEKIIGGSRAQYGGLEENLKIINDNISYFGMEDFIKVVIGDVSETAKEVDPSIGLGLLCLDADGAIDRDFGLFYDMLLEGSPIIVDDVLDRTRVKRLGRKGLSTWIKIDQKHRLTDRLLSLFRKFELVDVGITVGNNTWFGHKLPNRQFSDIPIEEILNVYRSLTFSEATFPFVPFRTQLGAVLRSAIPSPVVAKIKKLERGE